MFVFPANGRHLSRILSLDVTFCKPSDLHPLLVLRFSSEAFLSTTQLKFPYRVSQQSIVLIFIYYQPCFELSCSYYRNNAKEEKEMDVLLKPIKFLDEFEGRFDDRQTMPYMRQFWPVCFVFTAIYLVIIFGGTYLMRHKERWNLQRALCMWNTGLSAFSFIALFRIFPWEWNRYQQGGITFMNCDLTYLSGAGGNGLWAFMFMFSKLPELGDTVFIVLRKGHISFLHWYHHISVMCFTWWSYAYPFR